MNAPAQPKRDRQKLEEEAKGILERHDMFAVPVDPVVLAGKTGIQVHNAVFSDDGIAGMIAKRGDHTTLLVNQSDHPYRKRFTIAHELGHLFLHLDGDGEYVDTALDLFRGEEGGPRAQEWEANRFAAALLMPGELVRAEIETTSSVTLEELAGRFRVSESAMGIRLSVLNLELPVDTNARETLST